MFISYSQKYRIVSHLNKKSADQPKINNQLRNDSLSLHSLPRTAFSVSNHRLISTEQLTFASGDPRTSLFSFQEIPVQLNIASGDPHIAYCRLRRSPYSLLSPQEIPVQLTVASRDPHIAYCRLRRSPYSLLSPQEIPVQLTVASRDPHIAYCRLRRSPYSLLSPQEIPI